MCDHRPLSRYHFFTLFVACPRVITQGQPSCIIIQSNSPIYLVQSCSYIVYIPQRREPTISQSNSNPRNRHRI